MAVGVRETRNQGEDPVGYDWLRRQDDGIKVGGIGIGGGVGVCADEGYGACVIDFDG